MIQNACARTPKKISCALSRANRESPFDEKISGALSRANPKSPFAFFFVFLLLDHEKISGVGWYYMFLFLWTSFLSPEGARIQSGCAFRVVQP
jgi:formamidopyrimidine-DNA glycosylase